VRPQLLLDSQSTHFLSTQLFTENLSSTLKKKEKMAFNRIKTSPVWQTYLLKVASVLAIAYFPITGSRSIGGNLGSGSTSTGGGGLLVTFDPPPTEIAPEPPIVYRESELNTNPSANISGSGSRASSSFATESGESTSSSKNPCALVSMSFMDGKDGKLMSYEEKSLISILHPQFDVSHGIVPNIMYKGTLRLSYIILILLYITNQIMLVYVLYHTSHLPTCEIFFIVNSFVLLVRKIMLSLSYCHFPF
jgi:hypothetical protein